MYILFISKNNIKELSLSSNKAPQEVSSIKQNAFLQIFVVE